MRLHPSWGRRATQLTLSSSCKWGFTLRTTWPLISASHSQAVAEREAASSRSRRRTERDDDVEASPTLKRVCLDHTEVDDDNVANDAPSPPADLFEVASSTSSGSR
jgi:hypothetical protein